MSAAASQSHEQSERDKDMSSEVTKRGKMRRSASTNAENPRTAWCPVILKTKQCYEIHILWKDSRNTLKLFQTVKEKKEFGLIKTAEFVKEKNNKAEVHDYYKLENEYGDKIFFRSTLLSPALIGSNGFSKKLMELRCQGGGDIKIATYISLLSQSKGFSHHDSNRVMKVEAHDNDEQEDFKVFLEAACEDATIATLGNDEAVKAIASKTNRKRKSNGKSTPKSKQSKIEKFFTQELKDPKGVEREHVEGFQARADVHIDHLEVCQKVLLPMDDIKVKMLAKEMLERFDPSKVTLTVVPLDPGDFNKRNTESVKYEVVHGRHR